MSTITSVLPMQHERVDCIISIYRVSSDNAMEEIHEQLGHENNLELFNLWLEHHAQHGGCHCQPKHISILLIGVPSNRDSSTSSSYEEFRKTLSRAQSFASVAILTRSEDGFSTNIVGLAKLFRPYIDEDLLFSVHRRDGTFQDHKIAALVKAIDDFRLEVNAAGVEFELVSRMSQMSENKAVMSSASQTLRNLNLYMRNTRVSTPGRDGPRTRCAQCGARVLDGQMAQHLRRHNITLALEEEEEQIQAVQAVVPRRPASRLEAMRAKRQRRE